MPEIRVPPHWQLVPNRKARREMERESRRSARAYGTEPKRPPVPSGPPEPPPPTDPDPETLPDPRRDRW